STLGSVAHSTGCELSAAWCCARASITCSHSHSPDGHTKILRVRSGPEQVTCLRVRFSSAINACSLRLLVRRRRWRLQVLRSQCLLNPVKKYDLPSFGFILCHARDVAFQKHIDWR